MHRLWRSTTASLVAWNLLPLVGILGLGWDPLVVLVLYWAELYVVVALNVPKVLLAAGDRVGRRPDDVQLWQGGPPARLGNVWVAALSVLVYRRNRPSASGSFGRAKPSRDDERPPAFRTT